MFVFVFLFVFGCLLCGFGLISMIANLPTGDPNMPFKEAFSEMFDNDKFTISVFCMVLGFLIVIFLLSLMCQT